MNGCNQKMKMKEDKPQNHKFAGEMTTKTQKITLPLKH